MSRERCLSLDRAKRQQQKALRSGGYMPERSPHRSPRRTASPQYSPSSPQILRDSFQGCLPEYSYDDIEICPTPKRLPRPLELQREHALEARERQRLCSALQVPQTEELPDEYLEDFAQPSFYEPPENSSFDDLMCILATPPSRVQARAESQLYTEDVDNVVECPQTTEISSSPAMCPYKIPPLPDDPYDIPPHPKDPKDVVGFIRRSRAIHRLNALKEAEAAAARKRPKIGVKKGVSAAEAIPKPPVVAPKMPLVAPKRPVVAPKRPVAAPKRPVVAPKRPIVATKRPAGLGKPQIKKVISQPQIPKGAMEGKKEVPSSPEHPPDYIAPEYAAAILKGRQIADLKTRHSMLFSKPKITSHPPPIRTLSPPRLPAKYDSILERAAAARAKSKAARGEFFIEQQTERVAQPQHMRSPYYQGTTAADMSLDEFEELERQLGAECVASLPPQPLPASYETIIERAAAARAKSKAAISEAFREQQAETVACPITPMERVDDIGPQPQHMRSPYYQGTTAAEKSLDEFEELERQLDAECIAVDEFEALERQLNAEAIEKQTAEDTGNISLDEFEALEREMYSTTEPTEAYCLRNRIEDLKSNLLASGESQLAAKESEEYSMRKRIYELQANLLGSAETPKSHREARVAGDIMQECHAPQTTQPSPVFEMPPVIRFFELMKRREAMTTEPSAQPSHHEVCVMPEYAMATNQFQDIADWNLAEISDICPSPSSKSPVTRRTDPSICPRSFHDTLLEGIPIPDEDLDFSDDIDLGDITMPEEDMTPHESALEDITSPELDDLSISALECYDPDYPLEFAEKSRDKDLDISQEQQTSPGFLTTVVSAVVDKFRNIFSGSPKDVEEDEDEPSRCINLDSSLPNMFATTPPPRVTTSEKYQTVEEEQFTIPKYPKEDIAMVKKSQLIYKQKAKEAAEAVEAASASKGKKKPLAKSTIPKSSQKKQEPPAKIYPPGEYSPRYAADVARARSLAGYKNRSAILNPERAAKIAALQAAKEAEIAAEEALPPVERMRKRIARLQQKGSRLCPKPSIEALGALEAIRANLPRPKIASLPNSKWAPATRRRADKGIKEVERIFKESPIRVFDRFKPMTPLSEESQIEEDLINFSPLRAREGRLRLKHLKLQAERRDRQLYHDSQQKEIPTPEYMGTPETASIPYSPVRLHSPSRPRSEEFRMQAASAAQGDNRGEQSIREEVTETSTIENGEVHTITRKVTTRTDEFGNVACHVEETTGPKDQEGIITDNIDAIEAPEFLDISDIDVPSRGTSIPSPSQIIDRIRLQVQQKLNQVHPELPPVIKIPATESLGVISFPEDLPDEQLYDIDIPELDTTPQQLATQPRQRSPDSSLPYFWSEEEQVRSSQPPAYCPPIPPFEITAVQKPDHASPLPKTKSPESPVLIPPCPKDPNDHVGMVLYARAIDKRKQQQEAEAAARTPLPFAVKKNPVRVPISRRIGTKAGKQILPKKKPKKNEPKQSPTIEDDVEIPTEPPPLPIGYAEEVARARQLAGYKNRTAALNPEVAAELAEFEALSEYGKIMKRMEKVRRISSQKRRIEPNANIIGTFEGIKASMPPIDKRLPKESSPICKTALPIPSQELQEQELCRNLSLDEFEAFEKQCVAEGIVEAHERQAAEHDRNLSLEEYEQLERQLAKRDASAELEKHADSLDEFEALELQMEAAAEPSLDEALERQLNAEAIEQQIAEDDRNKSAAEAYCMSNRIDELKSKLLASGENQLDAEESREYSMRKRIYELQAELLGSDGDEGREPPAYNQAYYQELMKDFCPAVEQFGRQGPIAFGEGSTPVDPRERLRRIKEYQQLPCPTRELSARGETFASPSVEYSPIRLLTPSGKPRAVATPGISPGRASSRNVLVDLETPKIDYRVKRFRDLEDMPFDELEFEDEPSFAKASFDKPLTPPPPPSELINRIRKQVQERLRNDKSHQNQITSINSFQFAQQLPEENLFDLSDPSFAHRTLGDTPKIISARMPSPGRTATQTSSILQEPEVVECPMVSSPVKPVEALYQPRYPKGYVEMVMKARAIHKLKQQQAEMAAAAPPSEPTKKKGRLPITKPGGKVVIKKGLVRPPKMIKKKEKPRLIQEAGEIECPAEPPSLPAEYLADVARARQLAGYKNRTAALNPEVAAEAAAFAALTEHEKIKFRVERLKKDSRSRQKVQPNMEQLAFIQAMKATCGYETPRDTSPARTVPQRLSTTPRPYRIADMESDLDEFEALERELASPHILCPRDQPDNIEEQLFDEELPEMDDSSSALAQMRMKADAQLQQLVTPPRVDARERYKRLLSQIQMTPKAPGPPSPIQTPDIHFSPINFPASPKTPKRTQRSEKSTTQVSRSGDNTIKEQVIETSEIVNGQFQQVTKLVTTTTDPSGNVSCQTNESRHLKAKHTSAVEDELEDIEQPSFLDVTPTSPIDVPRPRDIIDRIRRDVKSRPRPLDVPTGQLIDLRTPPRELPLPQDVTEEELLEMSCPALSKTPTKSPMRSPRRSPVRSQDVSIPELFAVTPEPQTPPLPPVSPLRYRVHSPEGPIVIPPCPKDPNDYKGMVRMSRKIYELRLQKEAEAKAAAEAAAIEAAKPKKKERVPISRWTAPPPKKPTTRKRLVMRKRDPVQKASSPDVQVRECPSQPPPLPEGYAEEVAIARELAGLRRAATVAEEASQLNAPPPPPADYASLMSRMTSMRQSGHMPKVQASLQSAAYINAVRSAMNITPPTGEVEPAETRYKRILAARAIYPRPVPEECSIETIPLPEEAQYTPVVLGTPTVEYVEDIGFDMAALQDIGDLGDIQEPSFLEASQSPNAYIDRYVPSSPKTPPPTPAAIIRRIRGQGQQKLATEKIPCPMSPVAPTPLYFPKDLPEEELFELSAPSFARTPRSRSPTQAFTPNVSIPRYFEDTYMSPRTTGTEALSGISDKEVPASSSPPLMGVHPGLRVVTPEGPLALPPHPKGRETVVDMIRRAQLIQKCKQQEAAKAKAKVVIRPGARIPISRRLGGPMIRATKKSIAPVKSKLQSPVECPAEPPELPPEYVAAVARARRLAGLKNTTALLNPPQDYGTILARAAALKAGRGEIESTAQELAEAENVIRRPEPKEINEQPQTPRPTLERYRAYRSRVQRDTPTTSKIPYSPVKTPVLDHLPPYTPICLAQTPPFLQNINMSDIGDISMPYDMDDGATDTGDICMPLAVHDYGPHEYTNLDDISMSYDANEYPYCRQRYSDLECLKSTEKRCREARRR